MAIVSQSSGGRIGPILLTGAVVVAIPFAYIFAFSLLVDKGPKNNYPEPSTETHCDTFTFPVDFDPWIPAKTQSKIEGEPLKIMASPDHKYLKGYVPDGTDVAVIKFAVDENCDALAEIQESLTGVRGYVTLKQIKPYQ